MSSSNKQDLLRRLPKVDQVLDDPALAGLLDRYPRRLVVQAVRETIEQFRSRILGDLAAFDPADLALPLVTGRIEQTVLDLARPRFRRVINAAGVVIHTNLGRSLLADEAVEAVAMAARRYNNLEFDLASGRRGSRYSHVESLLCDLTGAEAALVVNNNASAVLICLETLAKGREVIVSRGELVEIGGSFRIPDVMARSGAILVEVGTTNKTHLFDYENAVRPETGLILKVHQSNFRIMGFTEAVAARDLTALGQNRNIPVMEDLGSGSLVDFSAFGLRREPTVQETVASGVDVTTFSGDKLLGGPQAGIIVGRKPWIDLIKKNPLNRALRIDKFTLAALEATLRLYLDEARALDRIPTLRMIVAPYALLRRRAARLARLIAKRSEGLAVVDQTDGYSQIGGGAMPDENLKTRLVTIQPLRMSVNRLEERLRAGDPPVVARIEDDRLVLDVRTVADDEFGLVAETVRHAAGGGES